MMSSNRNHIKKKSEKQIGLKFLKYYNDEKKTNYNITGQPSPPHPDIECVDSKNGRKLRLEITEFWEQNNDAKENYDLAKGKISESELFKRKLSSLNNKMEHDSDKKRLKQILTNKLGKHYAGSDDIVLVIYDQSPYLDEERLDFLLSNISIIDCGPFESIYFLLLIPWTEGEYRIYTICSKSIL